ncbi:hypothetical protein Sjap_010846 [Stephania japonica]|uniref:Nuclear nucleic acid-binding protein C1D n=1 Tax=Stephania japonica TaxID=461633 RepID=A0AAP0P4Y2_9MAGN
MKTKRGNNQEEETNSVIPEPVIEAAKRTSSNVEELRTHFTDFLAMADAEALAEMPPLARAQSLFALAKAVSTLVARKTLRFDMVFVGFCALLILIRVFQFRVFLVVSVRLRCHGVHPDEHPINTELERLRLYQEKLDRAVDLSKAPLKPSTTLNYKAATRFIEHSLPDLTKEQKQSMREISSRGNGKSRLSDRENGKKKRKYQSSRRQSVQAAAEEFLQKAAKELLARRYQFPLWNLSFLPVYFSCLDKKCSCPSKYVCWKESCLNGLVRWAGGFARS